MKVRSSVKKRCDNCRIIKRRRAVMVICSNTLLKRTGIGLFANLPGLANGGSAQAGRSYLVGERGPEIFTPKRSGVVIPNNQISSGSSGGIVNNINVNVSAEGMESNANEQRGKELGVALASAIQSEIIKQKRPGGLLAT